MDALELVGLTSVADRHPNELPLGQQKLVGISRALALGPIALLLDEPAAGMNGPESQALMHLIRDIRERYKLTVLLIEHDMKVVMGISDRVTVLDHGEKIAEGTPAEVRRSATVRAAYLGSARLDDVAS